MNVCYTLVTTYSIQVEYNTVATHLHVLGHCIYYNRNFHYIIMTLDILDLNEHKIKETPPPPIPINEHIENNFK